MCFQAVIGFCYVCLLFWCLPLSPKITAPLPSVFQPIRSVPVPGVFSPITLTCVSPPLFTCTVILSLVWFVFKSGLHLSLCHSSVVFAWCFFVLACSLCAAIENKSFICCSSCLLSLIFGSTFSALLVTARCWIIFPWSKSADFPNIFFGESPLAQGPPLHQCSDVPEVNEAVFFFFLI